jgi:hypothetical protein
VGTTAMEAPHTGEPVELSRDDWIGLLDFVAGVLRRMADWGVQLESESAGLMVDVHMDGESALTAAQVLRDVDWCVRLGQAVVSQLDFDEDDLFPFFELSGEELLARVLPLGVPEVVNLGDPDESPDIVAIGSGSLRLTLRSSPAGKRRAARKPMSDVVKVAYITTAGTIVGALIANVQVDIGLLGGPPEHVSRPAISKVDDQRPMADSHFTITCAVPETDVRLTAEHAPQQR